ncbi:hypothetical protein ACIQVU_16075 [Lysinibacillus sp. NPDC098008]|uniref:hypothetical protein n=1 Tax=Lysinibacillus sp. NPDC098008 TaxID=3364146 RepID=UPI0038226955
MRKQILLIILVIAITVISPIQSKALTCVEVKEPAIDYYDVAIFGTIVKVKTDIEQKGFTGPKEWKKYVLVDVEKSWKKEADSQLIFEADYASSDNFEQGKKYVLYLDEKDGAYYSSSPCTPDILVNSSSDYEQLGKGLEPVNQVNLSYKMLFMNDKDIDLGITIVIIAILFIIIWRWIRVKSLKKST